MTSRFSLLLGFGVVTLYTMRDVSRALHEGYRDLCGLPREFPNSLNGKSLTHINAPCGQERVFFQKSNERRITMNVKEMMHKGVKWVSPDTPIAAIAKTMKQYDIGAIPVGENDRLVGMVTDRDIAVRGLANGKNISKLTARNVMTKGVFWCRDSDSVTDAVHLMEAKHVRRLPVIDEKKRMVGMLSLGDISHAASQKTAAEMLKKVSGHHA